MINIGITGCNGMLAFDLIELLSNNSRYQLNCYDLPVYDITSKSTLERIVINSDIIINCAAYTAVDDAEKNIDTCFNINAYAVENLGKLIAKYNKYLIHISTDFVFGDDCNSELSENSKTNPLSIYGKSKLKGEQLLETTNADYSIIRLQWTYGKHGSNFISKILNLASKFDSLRIVNDQIGSPTNTEDAANAILSLIKKKPKGLFHFAANGYTSRYETAKFIFNFLNINKTLTPCSSEEFQTPAKRPKNSRFNCLKIDRYLDFKRPVWQDSLKLFLKKNINKTSTYERKKQ